MHRRFYFLLLLITSSACGRCDAEKPPPVQPAASSVVSASPSAEPVSARGTDAIEPVYSKIAGPPDPRAEKFCAALHELPAKRRADCCSSSPGFLLTSECVRTLSHALRDKSVDLDSAAVETCVSAMNTAHEGCEWVGPTNVNVPSACEGIIRVAVAEGKTCRSSLECVDGLRCLGVGPTDAGVCRKPLPTGYPCTLAVDTLAALTRQDHLDVQHPECTGFCSQRRCQDTVALQGACKTSEACGAGRVCLGGKCVEGALPTEGKPCAQGACANGLRCDAGTCHARKSAGARCSNDTECQGGCIRGDGGKEGTCGMKCNLR
ncbi:MAG TPA: hypothetical protein PK156_31325 [Polyangium sp.]|nr:hypothetical protein [Polyangium sp.]